MNENKILELIKEENPANPLEYVKDLVKPLMIDKINSYIISCKDCPNRNDHIKTIPYGNINASILIIGNQALQEQLKLSKENCYPFEGTEEKECLDDLLEDFKINKNQLYWVNAVNCLTTITVNNEVIFRPYNITERNNCKVFLDSIIETINPKLIICLGSFVANMFINNVSEIKFGNIFSINGIDAIAIQSPTVLLEKRGLKDIALCEIEEEEFCNHLLKAFTYCQEKYGGNIILDK